MDESMDDLAYLRIAYKTAATLGTDPSTQNGALLVDEGGNILIAVGNHFPYGVKSSDERWQRPLKYSFVEHAERNAIYMAARKGIQTLGLKMYCPWFACPDCARAIVQAGIKEVTGHDFDLHKTAAHWLELIAIADQILTEGKVEFRRVPGKIGDVKIRFNGQEVEP